MKKKGLEFSAALLLTFCLAVSASAPVLAAQEVVGGAPVSEAEANPEGSVAAAEAEALGVVPVLTIEAEASAPESTEKTTASGEEAATTEKAAVAVKPAEENTEAAAPPSGKSVAAAEAPETARPETDGSMGEDFAETEDEPLTDEDLEARDAVTGPGVASVQAGKSAAREPVVEHSRSTGKALTTNWSQVSALRKEVVDYAKQFEGGTYTYGGTTPDSGFDCSGFIMYVMKQTAGITLQHQSAAQARSGVSVTEDEMKPGDIIAYDGQPRNGSVNHVSIYIGDGKAIHAVGTGKGIRITAWNYAAPLEIRNVLGD